MGSAQPTERRAPGIKAVLFDLDGTLADTAPDLVHALNTLRHEHGLAPVDYTLARGEASHGSGALLKLGFGVTPEAAEFESLRTRFLALYADSGCARTRLFPGMEALLEQLRAQGLQLGIVTNKPSYLTAPVLAALRLGRPFDCVVSGDTTPFCKPHPEPLRHAARMLEQPPAHCVFVGDAERDIVAGRAAGMYTLVALFGYLRPEDRPATWGADGLLETPADLWTWLAPWT